MADSEAVKDLGLNKGDDACPSCGGTGRAKAYDTLKKQASPNAAKAGFFGASDDMADAERISSAVPRKK